MPADVYSLPDGIIEPSGDSPIGVTSDVFTGKLFKRGRDLWICLISVYPSQRNRGHFTGMLRILMDAGYRVRVACPSLHMREILGRRGFMLSGATCKDGICPYMEEPAKSRFQTVKQNGTFIEALYGCTNNGRLIDDPDHAIEIKSCQEWTKSSCSNGSRRYGRFQFEEVQHQELIRVGGRYHLVVHDGTCRILHEVLVEARVIDQLIRPTFQRKWPYFFQGAPAGCRPAGQVQEVACPTL